MQVATGWSPDNVLLSDEAGNALALQTGGGLDIRLKHHFSIRAIQVDDLRSQLPNGGTNVQNNLRRAGGLVF